jgi:hypothetical protein
MNDKKLDKMTKQELLENIEHKINSIGECMTDRPGCKHHYLKYVEAAKRNWLTRKLERCMFSHNYSDKFEVVYAIHLVCDGCGDYKIINLEIKLR